MVLPLRLVPRLAAAARFPCAPRPISRRALLLPSRAMAAAYSTGSGVDRRLLFRQLFEKESSTYTYLLADVADPDKPAVVSPVLPVRGIWDWLGAQGFRVLANFVVETGLALAWAVHFGWNGFALKVDRTANSATLTVAICVDLSQMQNHNADAICEHRRAVSSRTGLPHCRTAACLAGTPCL